jgi:hypothetical protein
MIFLKDGQDRWTVVVDGMSYVFDKEHPKYNDLVNAVISSNEEFFKTFFMTSKEITEWSEGNFKLEGGYIRYKGRQLHNVLSDYILGLVKSGKDYGAMLKFTENLYLNPSFKVVERLYQFLSYKNMPITSDGCFLGYKAVTSDFMDKKTRTINNDVGQKPIFERNMVDDNMNQSCSYGLHVGTLSYVNGFANNGDNIIICKVNPANVVAIPYDDAQKLRCCEYEVVDLYRAPLDDVYDDSYDEEEEDDECECDYCGSEYCDEECCEEEEDDSDWI